MPRIKKADIKYPPLIGSELHPPINPILVTEVSQLAQVAAFLSRVTEFGFDTETNMAKDFSDRTVRTLQLGDRYEQYIIDLLPFAGSTERLKQQGHRKMPDWASPVMQVIESALCSDSHVKVGHNTQFEYECMRWCFGLRTWNYYDTLLAEKVIHCGNFNFYLKGFWGLGDLAKRYCQKEMSKQEQTGFDLETPLRPEQIEYAAVDVRIPLYIKAMQRIAISEDARCTDTENPYQGDVSRAVQIENDCIPAIGEMRLNGMLLDTEAWLAIVTTKKAEQKKNVAELDKHFIPKVGLKDTSAIDLVPLEAAWRSQKDKDLRKLARQAFQAASREKKQRDKEKENPQMEGEAKINYGSEEQLLKALWLFEDYSQENLPATHDKLLRKFAKHPVIIAIREYRKTRRILDNYGTKFVENYINPVTGRIHPNIKQLGADTGRTGARSPNSQNIPPDQRKCFVARPGYVIITSDMASAEPRLLAELSGDPTWIKAFADNVDIYSLQAQILSPAAWKDGELPSCNYAASKQKCKCPKHTVLRSQIKVVVLAVAYGMEAYAVAESLNITPNEAKVLLAAWHDANGNISALLHTNGQNARKNFRAFTISGRRRIFHKPHWPTCAGIALKYHMERGEPAETFDERKETKFVWNSQFGVIEREGKNTPQQGCVSSATRVFERQAGYVEIQSLAGQSVDVWDGDKFVSAEIVASGPKQLIKVELYGGFYIECSPDHKFLVKGTEGRSSWKSANDIKKLDRVMLTSEIPEWSAGIPLVFPVDERRAVYAGIGFNQCSVSQLGEWLGRVASDGHVSPSSVRVFVAEHEEGLLEPLKAITEGFGLPVSHSVRQNEEQPQRFHSLEICSRRLCEEMLNAGIKIKIPEFVWRCRSLLAGYLRGLFDGDGHVSKDGVCLTFGQGKLHLNWARQVQQALLLFGVRSRVQVFGDNRTNVVVMRADCAQYAKCIGFLNEVKQNKLRVTAAGTKRKRWMYGSGFRVKNIDVTDERVEMYDAVNSESGQFMANGFVVHNSNADIAKVVMTLIFHELPKYGADLINFVHDEFVVECPEESAEACRDMVGVLIRTAGAEFMSKVVMESEANISVRWEKKD